MTTPPFIPTIVHVEFVDAIPKSPSGKILRRVLVQKEKERARIS